MATTHWLSSSSNDEGVLDCLCIGTGRFLRSVLVPALVGAGYRPILVQTRGRSFLEYILLQNQKDGTRSCYYYEVDTVLRSGLIQTDRIPCYGAFSLGAPNDKQAIYDILLPKLMTKKNGGISVIGLGVTEAGLASHDTPVMKDLFDLLCAICDFVTTNKQWNNQIKKICVIDMDNVPNNGQVVKNAMMHLARDNVKLQRFLEHNVAFLNTMVDRITSQRDGSNGLIPRAEPIPEKALVILDEMGDLPDQFSTLQQQHANYGVVVRSTLQQFQADISLKLRIANGTHTAIAHLLALLQFTQTDCLSRDDDTSALLLNYLDALAYDQIIPAATATVGGGVPSNNIASKEEAIAVYKDWRNRLTHPHFGLSSFFITQNGPAKGGIRLGPTVQDLIQQQASVSVAMAYAFAVLLRWLTPKDVSSDSNSRTGIYAGWFPSSQQAVVESKGGQQPPHSTTVEYADQLRYNLEEGWYEFKCACTVTDGSQDVSRNLSEWLVSLGRHRQPSDYVSAIKAYLTAPDGGNLGVIASPRFDIFTQAVATLYARMVEEDDLLLLLKEMESNSGPYHQHGMSSSCSVLVDNTFLHRPLD